jgi:crotonobetainyl-CoA:carnitine CoA-transferase CaiB-like acyl-CoA transferase
MAGPLAGIVVLDLTRALAGPHATMLLGDMGARVIKVERPGTGDESRHWGPPFVTAPGGGTAGEAGGTAGNADGADGAVSTYYLSCNRNKESVTCDIASAAGRELVERLARRADVLVENFRPGVLDRLGFSAERLHALNPGLVICSISGFGHDGPEGGRPGYDQIVQGEAGLMSVTGTDPGHPVKSGLSIADVLAGVHAALGIVAALHERASTGCGQVVRTSLLASIVGAHAFQGTRWTVAREVPEATGNHHPSIAPYGAYRCADDMIQVAVANEAQWRRFAPLVAIDPADGRFVTNALRVARRPELTALIEMALAAGDRGHWLGLLARAAVPAGAIRTIDEVYEWDQARSQGLVISVDHPELGAIELPGPALRFDRHGALGHTAPPALGQHDAEVRAWLDQADAATDRP